MVGFGSGLAENARLGRKTPFVDGHYLMHPGPETQSPQNYRCCRQKRKACCPDQKFQPWKTGATTRGVGKLGSSLRNGDRYDQDQASGGCHCKQSEQRETDPPVLRKEKAPGARVV